MKEPRRPRASSPHFALSRTAALALLANAAGAAQWREVEAPTVLPIEALAVSPTVTGQLTANLRTTSGSTYLGAGSAWSLDEAATWERNHSPQTPVLFDIEPHPTDPDVLFGAAFQVWKSTDRGQTWAQVYAPYNATSAVAVDPGNPERVYAVGPPVVPGSTFHRSLDGGVTWSATTPNYFDYYNDVIVVPSPGLGIVLIAGSGILRSVDGGATFTTALSGKVGFKLAGAAQNPLAVWCITKNSNQNTRLYRSVDGGLTWTKVVHPANDMNDILAHPTDPARAWVVGSKSGALYTLDGGQTWLSGTGLSPMANLHSIVWSSSSNTTLFAGGQGGFGGIWRSLDSGLTWQPASTGLKTPISGLHFDSTDRLYTSGLGVPLRRATVTAPWEVLEYSKGANSTVADVTFHPSDSSTFAWLNDTASQFVYDRLELTTDDGASWTHVTPPNAKNSSFEILAVAFDPAGALYAGGRYGDLHRSQNLGSTWSVQPTPWGVLRELVPDPHGASRLFATDSGAFYKSLDQGQSWTRHAIGPAAATLPSDLTVSPDDPSVLFVVAGVYEPTLYRTADAGENWTAVGAGLPAGITRVAVDPGDGSRLLVGTVNAGAYLSLDGGLHFVPWNEGIEGQRVVSVAFDPATSGRAWLSTTQGGFFVYDLP